MMPQPIMLSIITCDKTIRDIQTKKISLIDCFSSFCIPSLPFTVPQFFLFICMTDGFGTIPLTIQLRDLSNNELLLKEDSIKIEFQNPTIPLEFVIALNGVTFNNLGTYAFEIFTNGEFIGSTKISVISKPQNKESL
ncbi:MAG TPA: hypothetical protein VMX17_11695 [Candidatus Glassbacteria bacterium]|nr:hypothetical protein [Candidatus Glassbacteria bacterium]